jgi:hypothetical protein
MTAFIGTGSSSTVMYLEGEKLKMFRLTSNYNLDERCTAEAKLSWLDKRSIPSRIYLNKNKDDEKRRRRRRSKVIVRIMVDRR